MAVTIGTYGARDTTAWSIFTLPTTVIYVSDSLGLDTYDGTAPTHTGGTTGPFKTTLKAYNTAAALGNGVARWILLRRGDTFDGQTLTNDSNGDNDLYGPNDNPLLFSCYDEAFPVNTSTGAGVNPIGSTRARPKITPTSGHSAYGAAGGTLFTGGNWTAITGLHFYNKFNDPSNGAYTGTFGGMNAVGLPKPNVWSLVEDCLINYFSIGVDAPDGPNIYVRKNIFHDCPGQGVHGGAPNWIVDENIVVRCGLADLTFNHNFYMDGVVRKGEINTRNGNMKMRGNLSYDGGNANQFRSGALIDNNCFLSQNGGQNIGCPFPSVNNYITNNVWLELDASAVGAIKWTLLMIVYGGSSANNRGLLTISNNICANSIAASVTSFDLEPGMDHTTLSSNIFYKWGPSSSSSNPSIQSYSGSLAWGGLTITNAGSGYTDKSTAITAVSREAAAVDIPGNNVILTVASTADLNAGGVALGGASVYISGITGSGGFDTALNNKLWKCTVPASGTVILFGTESVPGSYTSGGTCYTPYRGQALTNVSSSGSGATVDIFIVGGQVVGFDYEGSEGPSGDNYMTPGVLYAVSDTVKSANLNTNAHGGTDGGFLATINAVGTNTIDGASLSINGSTGLITPTGGSNIMDPTGSFIDAHPTTYPHPGRTSGSYLNLLLSTTGKTKEDFANYCLDNGKNAYDNLRTAASLNDYIREGFGQSMRGSGYSDLQGTSPPVLMPQICL